MASGNSGRESTDGAEGDVHRLVSEAIRKRRSRPVAKRRGGRGARSTFGQCSDNKTPLSQCRERGVFILSGINAVTTPARSRALPLLSWGRPSLLRRIRQRSFRREEITRLLPSTTRFYINSSIPLAAATSVDVYFRLDLPGERLGVGSVGAVAAGAVSNRFANEDAMDLRRRLNGARRTLRAPVP
jgi:hypothetical protein